MNAASTNNPVYVEAKISRIEQLGTVYCGLQVSLPTSVGPVIPGQFAMLRTEECGGVLLPRPFSICDVDHPEDASRMDFIFRIVGTGTDVLSRTPVGAPIATLGPLGNGFLDPPRGHHVVLVAGGIGIASLLPLVRRLGTHMRDAEIFYGAKSGHDLVGLSELQAAGLPISVSTEDGSVGTKGMITSLVEAGLKKWTRETIFYACGPLAMLRTMTEFSFRTGCTCWMNLEERMACGVGACLGCVVLTLEGYKRVCKEGPVFEAKEIVWDRHA